MSKTKQSFLRKKPMDGAVNRAVNFGIGAAGTVGSAFLLNKVVPATVNPKIKGIGALAVGLAGSVFIENEMIRSATQGIGHYGALYLTGELVPTQKTNLGLSGVADEDEFAGLGNQDWDEMAKQFKAAEEAAMNGNLASEEEQENIDGMGAPAKNPADALM